MSQIPSNVESDPWTQSGQATAVKDFGGGAAGWRDYWMAEINAFKKESDKYVRATTQIVKRYRDDRDNASGLVKTNKRYNLLWSNVQTIRPAVFGRAPTPVVKRRYDDTDPVGRVAAIILERVLSCQIETTTHFTDALRHALDDRLLGGMGTVWVRYQTSTDSPTGTIDQDFYAKAQGELATVDYVYWSDFGFVPARTWEEVPAVWRTVYMSRKQLVERFGKVGETITLDYTPSRHTNTQGENTDEPTHQVIKQATIYEIWSKQYNTVTWLAKTHPVPLDVKQDPIGFPDFFPCPKPLFSTQTTGNLLPVADYHFYKDQAQQIDDLTQRMSILTKALKVVGVYDSESNGVQRMLTEGVENQLIPVDTWAAFAEKGGIKGAIDFLPVEVVATVLQKVVEMRGQLIEDVYQITGISDIVRGASNPNETLGAQRIKSQFASVRLEERKTQMAEFAAGTLRLMGHIATTFFDEQTLIDQSNILHSPDGQTAVKAAAEEKAKAAAARQAQMMAAAQPQPGAMPPPQGPGMVPQAPPGMGMPPGAAAPPPGPQQPPPMGKDELLPAPLPTDEPGIIAEAIQLLKSGRMYEFRVEVTADTMVEADAAERQEQTTGFLTSMTQYLQATAQLPPETLPLTSTLMMWAVRSFRVGRDIEGQLSTALDKLLTSVEEKAKQGPPPDPKVELMKQKGELDKQKAMLDAQATQQKLQGEMAQMQADMQAMREKTQGELQAMMQKAEAEIQIMREKAAAEIQIKREGAQMDAAIKTQNTQQEAYNNQMEHAQSMEMQQNAHEADMVRSEEDAAHERDEAAKEKKAEGED